MLNSSLTLSELVEETESVESSDSVDDAALAVVSDGDLLRRFLQRREEAAFALLVSRFGPMVLGIVLRTLRDRHAAEDAFQATFMVLARDARKIRSPESVGAWLHGTAMRVSKNSLQRRQREVSLKDPLRLVDKDALFDEINEQFQHQLLDEELQNLPENYRAPLVLHFLEGKTCEETAEALGTTVGAIRGRLDRGKRELRLRLTRRGVELSVVIASLTMWQSVANAAVQPRLVAASVQGGMAALQGIPYPGACSPEAVHIAAKELVMLTKGKILGACTLLVSTAVVGWFAHAGIAGSQVLEPESRPVLYQSSDFEILPDLNTTVEASSIEFESAVALGGPGETKKNEAAKSKKPQLILKYDDGKPDGRKSIAGTGEMIQFTLPNTTQKLRSVRIHCSRYGYSKAPDENVEISVVSEDGTEIVHTEFVPYSKFKRGESRWTTIPFEEALTVPEKFWVIVEFNAQRTKGVFVSYDSSTDGKRSKIGVPGGESKEVSFKGDWMIQAILSKPE